MRKCGVSISCNAAGTLQRLRHELAVFLEAGVRQGLDGRVERVERLLVSAKVEQGLSEHEMPDGMLRFALELSYGPLPGLLCLPAIEQHLA